MLKYVVAVVLLTLRTVALAGDLAEISNYRQYNESLSSSGQPTVEQLQLVSKSGFDRVIYLAFTDNDTAIEAEDRIVKKLGMEYVHIPVIFHQPSLADFQLLSLVLLAAPDKKTLLHCQINLRASTFSFLHRVINLNVPMLEAKEDLDSVWEPDEVWFRFIKTVLSHHDIDFRCEDCDWGPNELL
jgi:protein tyrosine phosphatase (PTP) superfamily phosphohydrolase (DUF442 family)